MNIKKKSLSAILVTLTFSLLLTAVMSVAYAKKPETIEGQFVMTGGEYTPNAAGNSDITIVQIDGKGMFISSGDITGPFTSEARWIAKNYSPLLQDKVNIHMIFTINLATLHLDSGVYKGTLILMLNGKLTDGGNWVILGGTDDLADLHGQGTFAPSATIPLIDYEGQVHFDP